MSNSDLTNTNPDLNLQRAINKYNEEHPGVHVKAEMGGFYEIGDMDDPYGYFPTYPIHYVYTDKLGDVNKGHAYFKDTDDFLRYISLRIEDIVENKMEHLLSKHKIYSYQVDIRTFNGVKTTLQWHPEDKSPKGMPGLFDHIKLGCIDEEDNWLTQEYAVTYYEWRDYYGTVYYLQKVGEE